MEMNLIKEESQTKEYDATVRFTRIEPTSEEESFDSLLIGAAKLARERNEFKGKLKETLLEKSSDMPRFHLLAGLGDKEEPNNLAFMSSIALNELRSKGAKSIAFILDDNADDNTVYNVLIGAHLKAYSFLKYKTQGLDEINNVTKIGILTKNSNAEKILLKSNTISESVNLARDLQNTPSNELTPSIFAGIAHSVAREIDSKYTVISGKNLEEQGYHGIASVGKGSKNEPSLVTIEYVPKEFSKTIAIVGKGITFDTGGISLKPSSGMGEMKFDMSGAATALATLRSAALMQLPVKIICVLCLAENMPSSSSYKPGDIIRTKSGKTIEIDNTDAEGRVVLADGLFHATTFNPDNIIDLATLTGAAVVALGDVAAAILGNNDSLISDLLVSSENTNEKVWQLPLWDDYKDDVNSKVADVKNTGLPRMAGTIAGAMLLKEFVNDIPWAHLDIAGVANMRERERYFTSNGGTGFGVRLLIDYLENNS
jgi:leucyl aminopeptidase